MPTPENQARVQKVFVLLIALTAIVAVVVGTIESGQWRSTRREANALQAELKNPWRLKRQLSDVRNQIESQKLSIQHLESNVSTIEYMPTMLMDLQKLGQASGLKIVGVRPQPKKVDKKGPEKGPGAPTDGGDAKKPVKKEARKPYDELTIDVQATGNFADVVLFLRNLSTFPKIVAVKAMTVNVLPKLHQVGPPDLDVTFSVRAYVFPVNAPTMVSRPGTTPGKEVTVGG